MQELIRLSPSIGYQKQPDGNIIAYMGCYDKKTAKTWLSELELRGWEGEIREAEVLTGENIVFELKLWRVSEEQIKNLSQWHHSPFESPATIQAAARDREKRKINKAPTGHKPFS